MFSDKYIFLLLLVLFNSTSFAESRLDNQKFTKTQKIVKNVCMACHGMDGNSLNGKIAPKIAAQNARYLTIQLNKFKDGVRKNTLMQGIAAGLSAEDMDNLGIYFSEQKLQLSAATSNGVGSMGEKIFRAGIKDSGVPACASCHGPAGHGVPNLYPRLNAQHSDYILSQLNHFRVLEDKPGTVYAPMRAISVKLTEQEMKAVADYIQGLQ
ncbi:cytochrome c4 [Methylophilaceae bacterium]|jgi:cytochrome c553|nr:cytochrome c4 [Methylophilaceae bacterium]